MATLQADTVEIAIIGAGPAGLMAAEVLSELGHTPVLYEAMPTPARKFLMAGKSGLNLTHSEALPEFLARYGDQEHHIKPALELLSPGSLRNWADDMGAETFVGSSGRVFPKSFKGSPLLRAWLKRLDERGVVLKTRHRWARWDKHGNHIFKTETGECTVKAHASVFSLGGASWPRLGADGSWVPAFKARGLHILPMLASNCGFDVDWSRHFRDRFAGVPVKGCILSAAGINLKGDFVITKTGVEGSAVYALSSLLRDSLLKDKAASLTLDLSPDRSLSRLEEALSKPKGKKSFSTFLKRATGLEGVKAGLLREFAAESSFAKPAELASNIKALKVPLLRPRPVAEAISVAGGIDFEELDAHLMLKALPGTFCAGEMLNWEAPTGGYLLTACIAQGKQAATGVHSYLKSAT